MSKKLFSLESEILEVASNPLELTKKLLAQKEEIKKELQNKFLNKTDDEEKKEDKEKNTELKKIDEDKEENTEEVEKTGSEKLKKIEDKEETVKVSEQDQKSSSEKEEADQKSASSNSSSKVEDEDISSAATDVESLKALVGSASANENIYIPKYKNTNIFQPLYLAYESYLNSLAKYKKLKPLSLEEQKVVYVKEAILEVLNNIINSVNKYIGKNNSLYTEFSTKLADINKEITIYSEALEHTSYAFNFKLVKDEDIILNLSIDSKPDLRNSIQSINKLLQNTSTLVNLIINNEIDKLKDAFIQTNFKEENSELEYSSALPAFNLLKAKVSNYIDYKNTDINSFEVYKVQQIKQDQLNSLSAFEISNDKDFEYYIENANKILFELSSLLEVLMTINTNFNGLLEKIKANIYDIENNKIDNLQSLNIDETLKAVIKFKLALDIENIVFRICFDFLSSLVLLLKLTVEVKTLSNS